MRKSANLLAVLLLSFSVSFAQNGEIKVKDVFEPLPAGNVKLTGYFDDDIQNSIDHWIKGVMPYDEVVEYFRTGRAKFALGEMPGKSLRSSSLMYRYTGDPELKAMTRDVVMSLLATARENGSISCTPVDKQPGDGDGDIWERKYVLLGLSQYYLDVDRDPAVLRAMEAEARSVMDQVGPAPRKSITELGWSSNNIESSSILEPFMRLYFITGNNKYLEYAKYIVESGGAKGTNLFEQVLDGKPMHEIGAPYPKAYEMTSIWEGLAEYYRATGDPRWMRCIRMFFENVSRNEITIIGNGGADVIWPKVMGEAWSNTAVEQTNPSIKRMMETCVGVTWMKYCSQYLRLTGDAAAVDFIERYAYNGLLGAMRPDGRGFSYVNLLNGEKVTNSGWGTNIDGLPVTCCNLNGPTGLAYIPYVAFMQSSEGPVVNLYNKGGAKARTASGGEVSLILDSAFPRSNEARLTVNPARKERFTLKLRIPEWSENTSVTVNGRAVSGVRPGTYLDLDRRWKAGDVVRIVFDMRGHLIPAPVGGRNPEGKYFQAVKWGPLVLARDESIDPAYDQPVDVVADPEGIVPLRIVEPERPGTRMEFRVKTKTGEIRMVDYSSVDCWEGGHIQTWLPLPR